MTRDTRTLGAGLGVLFGGGVGVHGPAPHARHPGTLTCLGPCLGVIPEPGSKNAVFEPVVAVDPQNENHIIIAAMVTDSGSDEIGRAHVGTPYLCANIHYHMTTDGGASWTSSEIPHGPNAGPNHPLAEATATYDPRLGFLPDGTILLEGRGLNSASASTSSGIGFA